MREEEVCSKCGKKESEHCSFSSNGAEDRQLSLPLLGEWEKKTDGDL